MGKKVKCWKKVLNCSHVTKPNGVGEPGVYPPLAGSNWVTTDPPDYQHHPERLKG